MRKKLKENKRDYTRIKQLFVGLLLAFVMLFSTLGFAFSPDEEEATQDRIKYGGYEFVKENHYWVVELGSYAFGFLLSPYENMNVSNSSQLNLLDSYVGRPVYIQSRDYDARRQIEVNLYNVASRLSSACYTEESCEDDTLPIKTCQNNFIIIQENVESKIEQTGNCVLIEGVKEDLPMLVDEFIFRITGIKDNYQKSEAQIEQDKINEMVREMREKDANKHEDNNSIDNSNETEGSDNETL